MIRTVNLSLKNINPFVNKEYRTVFYEDNETLNGVYTDNLVDDINLFLEYCEGRIALEGDTNFEEYKLPSIKHTHESIKSRDIIFRRNETEDFTRVLVRNLPPEAVKRIDRVAWVVFGRAHGNASRVVSMAMIFGLKLRRGVTCIAEKSRLHAKQIIESKGVVSPLLKKFEIMEQSFDELKEENRSLKGMLQTVLDFFKGGSKFLNTKKIISNSKSLKRNKRALSVVNSLKMINKSSFSEEDYAGMVDLHFGVGDLRTVRGDLQAALRRKLIVMRHSKYYFVDNDLYDGVHGPEARRAFNEKMKAKLREFKNYQIVTLFKKPFIKKTWLYIVNYI